MQLGTFQKDTKTGVYTGSIRTLASVVELVRIVPRPAKTPDTNKEAPDYDVLGGAGGSDFGAGWTQKRQSDGIEYISLKLYDPTFNNGQTLRPALWPRKDGTFVMIHEPLDPNAVSDPLPPARDAVNGTGQTPPPAKETASPAPGKRA